MSAANGNGNRRPATRTARLALALAAAAILSLTAAAVAQASPAWRIDALTDSTIAPGASLDYFAQVTNVGDQPADGSEIDVTVTLPNGVLAQSATLFDLQALRNLPCFNGSDGVSPVAGASSVVCKATTRVPFQSGGDLPFMRLSLTTSVDNGAAGTLEARFAVSGGGGGPASTVAPVTVTRAAPAFGIAAFDGSISGANGVPLTQAGGHPAFASVSLDFDTETNPAPGGGALWPVEAIRDVITDLPPGFVGDPAAADTCTVAQLASGLGLESHPQCPVSSQVGTTTVRLRGLRTGPIAIGPLPVYNMVAPPDVPAEFGFDVYGSVIVLRGSVRSGGDYGISVDANNIPAAIGIAGTTVTFWGDPASSIHDSERQCPGDLAPIFGGRACRTTVTGPHQAFLRNPTSCTAPGVGLPVTVHVDSWANPGIFRDATWITHDPPGYPLPPGQYGAPVGTDGCPNVPFSPQFSTTPEPGAAAGEPAAFSFDLTMPQNEDPASIGEADLRTAQVTLPLGVRVSPSSADGLGACSPADIKLGTELDPTCPDSSKIGTVEVRTPLLRDPLEGSVYLARPNDNPFGTLLSIYLVARGPGVVIKLPGRVDADPISGQLSTTFDNNPQLPFSDLHVAFKGGSRAPLVMPTQCGAYTTHAVMTGWNGSIVADDSAFTVSDGGNGAPCLGSAFSPGLNAGTADTGAGKTTTFNLRLTRGDADQQLAGLTVHMPEGLLGKVANATLCAEGDAARGACPDGTKIGDVTVGAGAGPNPFYITTGRAYLTGPYKGAPFGLSIVVPAVAGPFDLGNVNVRAALSVDKHDSTLRVVSDPLPTILQGIPLDVRDIRVSIDRSNFIVNPTSCASKSIDATVGSVSGATANVSSHFEVGRCSALAFAPSMALYVGGKGHIAKNRTTPLMTKITMPPGQANLRYVRVTLPGSINARLTVIQDACTRAQFEADIAQCAHAQAGTAVAFTPLLRDPLAGKVYFVKNGHGLPDLFVALRGQVSFDLIGQISIVNNRYLRTTFPTAPDVPIRSFKLRLLGDSRNGSLGTTMDLCSKTARGQTAQLDLIGQNGKVKQISSHLRVAGCPKPRAK